jgi:hypothetical protein
MTQPFNVNDKVWLNDMEGRENVPAIITALPSDNSTTWTIEFEGDNEYGLTGTHAVQFLTDLTARDAG